MKYDFILFQFYPNLIFLANDVVTKTIELRTPIVFLDRNRDPFTWFFAHLKIQSFRKKNHMNMEDVGKFKGKTTTSRADAFRNQIYVLYTKLYPLRIIDTMYYY